MRQIPPHLSFLIYSLTPLVGSIGEGPPFCEASTLLELCPCELCQVYTHLLSDKLKRDHENAEVIPVCDFTYTAA